MGIVLLRHHGGSDVLHNGSSHVATYDPAKAWPSAWVIRAHLAQDPYEPPSVLWRNDRYNEQLGGAGQATWLNSKPYWVRCVPYGRAAHGAKDRGGGNGNTYLRYLGSILVI